MSEFGVREDVQQIPLLAPVMITVLPEPANSCRLATSDIQFRVQHGDAPAPPIVFA